MSDTVKLIIEIDKDIYDGLMNNRGVVIPSYWHEYVADLCKNGTPLDDVKAELEQIKSHSARFRTSDGSVVYVDSHNILEVLDNILDNIGKAESEDI